MEGMKYMEKKNVWTAYNKKERKEADALGKAYCKFLDNGKTERECVDQIVNRIEKEGYLELEELIKENREVQAGDKVYSVCMNKSIVLFQIGKRSMTEGINILGAHIDSPRLDVKQNPLYEDGGIAYLDTHYYGGVKKYHSGSEKQKNDYKQNNCCGDHFKNSSVFSVIKFIITPDG